MQKLLSDFLTVNRIQNGIITPVYSLVNMGNMVQEITEGYEFMAKRKGIEINFDNKCEESFFRTDMSYLSIIIDNLISNAVKYSARDETVSVKTVKEAKKYKLVVKNKGITIPEDQMPKMFGRFQKLGTSPTAGEPSNGLGLSIVKDLVDALNGTIECISSEEHTTFTVTFNA